MYSSKNNKVYSEAEITALLMKKRQLQAQLLERQIAALENELNAPLSSLVSNLDLSASSPEFSDLNNAVSPFVTTNLIPDDDVLLPTVPVSASEASIYMQLAAPVVSKVAGAPDKDPIS